MLLFGCLALLVGLFIWLFGYDCCGCFCCFTVTLWVWVVWCYVVICCSMLVGFGLVLLFVLVLRDSRLVWCCLFGFVYFMILRLCDWIITCRYLLDLFVYFFWFNSVAYTFVLPLSWQLLILNLVCVYLYCYLCFGGFLVFVWLLIIDLLICFCVSVCCWCVVFWCCFVSVIVCGCVLVLLYLGLFVGCLVR